MNCHRTGLPCHTPRRCDSARKCLYHTSKEINAPPRLVAVRETPRFPGFYWAKWRLCEDGTADEAVFKASNSWDVVEVWVNRLGPELMPITEGGELMVSVPGVERSQSVENFFWGPGPLDAPR